MRAAFAGFVFELIGCETMHNADKFARFPVSDSRVDCRIKVAVQDEPFQPHGEHLSQHGQWRCYPHGDRKRYYRRDKQLMMELSDDFSDIHLTFCREMPMLDIKIYLTVQQAIHSFLLFHNAALIHSAGLSVNGDGILLCGRSGVGKSTMTAHLQNGVATLTVLSEDAPAVINSGDGLWVSGTPLCGDDEQCENTSVPLSKIVCLRQAKENRLIALSPAESVYELLTVLPRVVHTPQLGELATDWCVRLADTVSVVAFENDGTEQAAHMLMQYIKNE